MYASSGSVMQFPSDESRNTYLGSRPDALLDPLGAILVRLIDELESLDI